MASTSLPECHGRLHWLVLGAGAIGGLWALRLAAAGHEVTLLSRHDEPARTLTLHDGAHVFTHRFPCCDPRHAPLAAADRLLVTTKAGATAAALAPLLPALPATLPVVLLQNGMGQENALLATRSDLLLSTAI
ncbi:MAG: 2-dehydropantoate 2-reductase N-terminal domain-containing protein, partial [Moraxellaceae bacterium]